MKSDVIRKRARHDARRGAGNSSSETPPSASPGASRRASPNAESTPTLAPDSSTQVSYSNTNETNTSTSPGVDYRASMQSELMGALGSGENQYSSSMFGSSVSSYFPGPYHPDYLSQVYSNPSDALPYTSGDASDVESGSETRSTKRRRMSSDSASEPPSSAVSFSSYSDSFTSASSSASHSQRSSVDFPFTPYSSFTMLRGSSNWHPPMLPPADGSSPHFVHPPMLPGAEDSPMFYHPPMVQADDTDALFAAYLHPPMLRPEDSPPMSSLQLHPPMLPTDWKMGGQDLYGDSNAMVTF